MVLNGNLNEYSIFLTQEEQVGVYNAVFRFYGLDIVLKATKSF
jgi:hypothetical protein